MRAYQVVGLVIVYGAVMFVAGLKIGQNRAKTIPARDSSDCTECGGPIAGSTGSAKPAPKIPTGSGLPCLVVFGSGECEECKKADAVLEKIAPRLRGRIDVVHLDPDEYPGETARWRVRIIPTQIVVGADGKELARIERFAPESELITTLARANVKLGPAATGAKG